tara:strand:+ start:889 stop:1566 length:678 start_codon:yes stop_codon:yes gene_type:complete
MSETVNMKYTIQNVEAMWPRINRTYKFDAKDKKSVPCDPFDDGASYTIQFRIDEAQAKDLYQRMKTAYAAKQAENSDWPDKFVMPFKKDDNGNYTHKAKLKGAYGTETTRKPAQWSASNKKHDDDFLLTNGSMVNISVIFTPYHGAMGTGVSLRLDAVQVISLKPMDEQSPFAAIAGSEESPQEDENPFEDMTVEEPKKVVKKATPAVPEKGSDDLSSIVDNWDD